MGFPPDSYELADLIEAVIGLIPVTNEHTDAIIEMAMGRYPVRGDAECEVTITNVDMAHVLAEDLRQVLEDEEPEAAMFAYATGTATVRRPSSIPDATELEEGRAEAVELDNWSDGDCV